MSEYFDNKISALVRMLEARVGYADLAQVRAEAYSARIVALLGAIERQVAALAAPGHRTQAEADFLEDYRRQARQRHGFLRLPDFDRRRTLSVSDIYVPATIREESYADQMGLTRETEPSSLKVWDLIERLGRTVLLGDPGGGKTTAANVLTHYFAADSARRIPFLVTLRDYAAKTPIEWSVADFIEHTLRVFYQSHPPDGLVEQLLRIGRAAIIFDGLDELLDTSRRRDVSDRVEQFCSLYPLTPVLVTSRLVGYEQARLDDRQFTCYLLGGFGDKEVAEYVRKWFKTQEGVLTTEAEVSARAFLDESVHARDLRANPLMLSLMCILYRGAGSLPGDRAGIYARCTELLLRKWDEQRDLYRKIKADHLVEPTIKHLAWWIFTGGDARTAVTERELIAETAKFLHGPGFETAEEARMAAGEFVKFCQDRMWVFSDAGTDANGERLYAFTHRTFLEYFTAWHMAAESETPEELAMLLAGKLAESTSWRIVGELAIDISARYSNRRTDRIYAVLLDPVKWPTKQRTNHLAFLASSIRSARPAPATARKLTRSVLNMYFRDMSDEHYATLLTLFDNGTAFTEPIADETWSIINIMITSPYDKPRNQALQVILTFEPLFTAPWSGQSLRLAPPVLSAIGRQLVESPDPPWGTFTKVGFPGSSDAFIHSSDAFIEAMLSPDNGQSLLGTNSVTALGTAAIICMIEELALNRDPDEGNERYLRPPPELAGVAGLMVRYVAHRRIRRSAELLELSVPEEFRQFFRAWADWQVDCVSVR